MTAHQRIERAALFASCGDHQLVVRGSRSVERGPSRNHDQLGIHRSILMHKQRKGFASRVRAHKAGVVPWGMALVELTDKPCPECGQLLEVRVQAGENPNTTPRSAESQRTVRVDRVLTC